MPRVVPDQKTKFETDELFKKLSQEIDVKYTAHRDRPVEERKRKFTEELAEGHSIITFVSTGTNLTLQFCPSGLSEENPTNTRPSSENVDFTTDPNRVYLRSRFIMNGVCVLWVGWIDLETLNGKAKLMYDEEQAKLEDELMRKVVKETQERVRLFEENQRRWQAEHQQHQQHQQHLQPSPMAQQPLSQPQ